MKKKRLLIFCLHLLLIGCLNLKNAHESVCLDSKQKNTIDSLFIQLAKDGLFNGEILIAQNNEIQLHIFYGKADLIDSVDFESNSVFEIASVSKPFTALAIAKLISENKLSYEDPIGKFFPNLSFPMLTIKQLLTHTSGLPDYSQVFYPNWDFKKIADNHELIKILIDQKPELISEPGKEWKYSNVAYTMLAFIIEKVTGESYPEYLERNIFEPLQMENTSIPDYEDAQLMGNYINDYVFSFGTATYVDPQIWPSFDNATFTANMYGAQGICTNAMDLFKFSVFLGHNTLLNDSVFSSYIKPRGIETPLSLDFTNGWFYDIDPILGEKIFYSGGFSGYRSFFLYFPETKTTIVLLSNTSTTPVWKIQRIITDVIKEKKVSYPEKSYVRELSFQINRMSSEDLDVDDLIDMDTSTMVFREYEFDEFFNDLVHMEEYEKADALLEKVSKYLSEKK